MGGQPYTSRRQAYALSTELSARFSLDARQAGRRVGSYVNSGAQR
jgi:hypothetical protein